MFRTILLSHLILFPWIVMSQSNLDADQQSLNDSGEMTWEEASRKVQEFMDAEALMNCIALDNTTKAIQIVEFLEGFRERNDFEVLFHTYVNGSTFWEHSFNRRKIAQWNSIDVETLKVRVVFDRIGESTEDGYTVSLEISTSPTILKSLSLTQTDLDAFLNENRFRYTLSETYQKPIDAHEAILQTVIGTLTRIEGKEMPELDLSIEGGLVYDHFIIHDDAWLRKPDSPGEFIKPTQRVDLGLRVALLQEINLDGKSIAKIRDKRSGDTLYITNNPMYLKKVENIEKETTYRLVHNYTALSLPYSNLQSNKTYIKNDGIEMHKRCGIYLKVKDEKGDDIEGFWINLSAIRSEQFYEILELLGAQERMSPKDIAEIRGLIIELENEEGRGDLYIELQVKVTYQNQRDNEAPVTEEDKDAHPWMNKFNVATAGDIMCNLTSQAMCLNYLGVDKPCETCPNNCDNSYSQLEDYIECIRVEKNLDERTKSKTRRDLSKYFNVSHLSIELAGKNAMEVRKILIKSLRAGKSVMLGGFGHMVRLQSASEQGLVVDDPYGRIVNFTAPGVTPKYKKNGKDYRNGKDFGDGVGEDNFWTWDQALDQIKVKYAETYSQ